MKILFEEYQYNTEDVRSVLGNFVLSGLDYGKTTQQLRYVGYFYNAEIENRDGSKGDLVFFLPKVLLDQNGLAFGIEPKRLLNFNWEDWKKDEFVVESGSLTKRQVYEFIYGFSTWIYRAVDIYRANQKKHPKKEDLEANVMTSVQIGQSGKKENVTFMDVLLSLLDFQKTHQGFITFVMKMAHSGFNKISWPKTIARTAAILQDGVPLYLNPINKRQGSCFQIRNRIRTIASRYCIFVGNIRDRRILVVFHPSASDFNRSSRETSIGIRSRPNLCMCATCHALFTSTYSSHWIRSACIRYHEISSGRSI